MRGGTFTFIHIVILKRYCLGSILLCNNFQENSVFMDKKTCLVSILCAAFNHGPYIADALEGFVNQQTDFDFEVLVNDDRSSDNTAEIIRQYAEKYPQIIRPFYQQENLFSLHRDVYEEFFFPNAKGRYVAMCEGDDYWCDPLKLQKQVDFLEAHPEYSACVHNSTIHDCSGQSPDRPFINCDADHDLSFAEIAQGMSHAYHTSSLLCRKEIISNHQDFYYIARDHGFSDYPDAIWLSLNGPVHFINEEMSVYRIQSNPHSWSANLAAQYKKRTRFVEGEIGMFKALEHHVSADDLSVLTQLILEREYELLFLEGKVEQMVKPPYNRIFKSQPFSERVKIHIKRLCPALHKYYRKKKGFY